MKVIIPLREIGYGVKKFHISIPNEEMGYSGEYKVLGDVDVLIIVQKTDIGYKIKIKGKTFMRFVCSRCLDEFEDVFEFSDDNVLKKELKENERLGDMDVETWAIDSDDVDVLPIIRDIFIVHLPINPLCSESCLGICPVCGEKMEGETHKHESKTLKLGDIISSLKRR